MVEALAASDSTPDQDALTCLGLETASLAGLRRSGPPARRESPGATRIYSARPPAGSLGLSRTESPAPPTKSRFLLAPVPTLVLGPPAAPPRTP